MQDGDMLDVFIYECDQQLNNVVSLLFTAESDGGFNENTIPELFRLVHTLKGSAAMMGYAALAETTHHFEDVLHCIRERVTGTAPESVPESRQRAVIESGFAFTDAFRGALDIASKGSIPGGDAELDHRFAALINDMQTDMPSGSVKPDDAVRPADLDKYERVCVHLEQCSMAAMRAFLIYRVVKGCCESCYSVPAELEKHSELDSLILSDGFELGFVPRPGNTADSVLELIRKQALFSRMERIGLNGRREQAAQAESPVAEPIAASVGIAERMVSVSQKRISAMMDLMSEVLTVESALERNLEERGVADSHTERLLNDLRHYSVGVQSALSELGLVEINQLFLKMKRLVRNLLAETGKRADIRLTGGDVMLDKGVIELLGDALLHIIRNAVDHGLESSDERSAAGKSEVGLITLSAIRTRGRVKVSVCDDGRGVSSKLILAKAKEKGMLTKPESEYTRKEVYGIMLKSGFSTQNKVTERSGRGVGMDAVYHAISKIGGTMSIDSTEGQGSQITLDIPITLTLLDALCIDIGERELYIPVNALERVVSSDKTSVDSAGRLELDDGTIYEPSGLGCMNGVAAIILYRLQGQGYYLPCRRIGRYETVLAKRLPPCAEQALGAGNIYSGCVMHRSGKIYCILDVEKLASATSTAQS